MTNIRVNYVWNIAIKQKVWTQKHPLLFCADCAKKKKMHAVCAGKLGWDWSAVVWNAAAGNRPFCKMS